MRELHVQLAGSPPGISGEHPRTRRRRQSSTAPGAGRWVTSTGTSPPGSRGTRPLPAPSPIRIQPRSGSTGPPMHSGIPLPPTIGGSSFTIVVAGISVGRFSTRPNAPSGAKSQSRTTVRAKFGSWSWGIERQQRRAKGVHVQRLPARPRVGRAISAATTLQVGDELRPSPRGDCPRPARAGWTTGAPLPVTRSAQRRLHETSALCGHLEGLPEQRLRGDGAEADEHARLDERDLASRARAARGDLARRWASRGSAACRAAPT